MKSRIAFVVSILIAALSLAGTPCEAKKHSHAKKAEKHYDVIDSQTFYLNQDAYAGKNVTGLFLFINNSMFNGAGSCGILSHYQEKVGGNVLGYSQSAVSGFTPLVVCFQSDDVYASFAPGCGKNMLTQGNCIVAVAGTISRARAGRQLYPGFIGVNWTTNSYVMTSDKMKIISTNNTEDAWRQAKEGFGIGFKLGQALSINAG